MASIIVRINSRKLDYINEGMENRIVQFVEKETGSKLTGDGYDYMGRFDLGIFFKTDDPIGQLPVLIDLLENNLFDGNSLKDCLRISVSADAAPTDYVRVYPERSDDTKDSWKRIFQR